MADQPTSADGSVLDHPAGVRQCRVPGSLGLAVVLTVGVGDARIKLSRRYGGYPDSAVGEERFKAVSPQALAIMQGAVSITSIPLRPPRSTRIP